jgi:hypothetical protein
MKKRKKTKPSPRGQGYQFEQLNALVDLLAVQKFRAVGHAYQSRQISLEQAEKFLLADRNTADVLLRIGYTKAIEEGVSRVEKLLRANTTMATSERLRAELARFAKRAAMPMDAATARKQKKPSCSD